MGEITIKKWQCDRCGVIDNERPRFPSSFSVAASVDYGTSGGRVIYWQELCHPCNVKVEASLTAMKAESVEDRQAVRVTPAIQEGKV
jgi:hypothetical protein